MVGIRSVEQFPHNWGISADRVGQFFAGSPSGLSSSLYTQGTMGVKKVIVQRDRRLPTEGEHRSPLPYHLHSNVKTCLKRHTS